MAKRPHLYWTPCAAHCLDLMLEDMLRVATFEKDMGKGDSSSQLYLQQLIIVEHDETFYPKKRVNQAHKDSLRNSLFDFTRGSSTEG